MTLRPRDPGPAGAERRVPVPRVEGAGHAPAPEPAATKVPPLKEHQAKQNERKELQGKPSIQPAFFSAASARGLISSNGPGSGEGSGLEERKIMGAGRGVPFPCQWLWSL